MTRVGLAAQLTKPMRQSDLIVAIGRVLSTESEQSPSRDQTETATAADVETATTAKKS